MRHNRFGIGPVDHFSIPCKDPAYSRSFYEAVLGAKLYEDAQGPYIFGDSPEDKALGRSVHIFLEMECGQRIELLGLDIEGRAPTGTHHAFKIGPNDLPAVRAHLESLGIPYLGPATHRGTSAVSVYFHDPDGNVLEFCCWNGYADLAAVPLSQHMQRRSLAYRWDAQARRAEAVSP